MCYGFLLHYCWAISRLLGKNGATSSEYQMGWIIISKAGYLQFQKKNIFINTVIKFRLCYTCIPVWLWGRWCRNISLKSSGSWNAPKHQISPSSQSPPLSVSPVDSVWAGDSLSVQRTKPTLCTMCTSALPDCVWFATPGVIPSPRTSWQLFALPLCWILLHFCLSSRYPALQRCAGIERTAGNAGGVSGSVKALLNQPQARSHRAVQQNGAEALY